MDYENYRAKREQDIEVIRDLLYRGVNCSKIAERLGLRETYVRNCARIIEVTEENERKQKQA